MISTMIRTGSFAEILDDLVAQSGNGTDAASPGRSFSGASGQDWLFSLFAQDAETVALPDVGGAAAFYREEAGEDVEPILEMAQEDQIAAELDLGSAATLADLARARRAFALRNHPDRFHPALRATANGRMQLANMLLDRRRKEIEAGR
ncbi:MAG: hypothetical protein WCF20_03715 [Methylovirgula sp.]